jgi:Glutaredoxin and related proteins
MSITVYSKSGCPECTFTKKYLESENISYEEKRVDLNETYLKEVILLGYRTLPVVKN